MAAEGLDFSIRFGNGAWHGMAWHGLDATELFEAPLTPLCTPQLAAMLGSVDDLAKLTLPRSYRMEERGHWYATAGAATSPSIAGAIVFDFSLAMMEAAEQGAGVALAPALCSPARHATVPSGGRFWLHFARQLMADQAQIEEADRRDDSVR